VNSPFIALDTIDESGMPTVTCEKLDELDVLSSCDLLLAIKPLQPVSTKAGASTSNSSNDARGLSLALLLEDLQDVSIDV